MHYTLSVFQALGFPVTKDSVIVDFGCGAGGFIREARAEGYNAAGCDFERGDGPETKALIEAGLIRLIEKSPYRLPYDDQSVDFVISETVLEHVKNPEEVAREIARILKPGGAAFHYFPARYSPFESHVYVPFASFFRPKWYLWLWAKAGIRNEYQDGMSADEVASVNADYLKQHTNYLTERQMRNVYGHHFSRVEFIESAYFAHSRSRKARLLNEANKIMPFIGPLYRRFWAVALLLVK